MRTRRCGWPSGKLPASRKVCEHHRPEVRLAARREMDYNPDRARTLLADDGEQV